jgi:opacity protein-like surface antigen
MKYSYSFLPPTLEKDNLIVPQFGSTSNPQISPFQGFAVTRSYEVFLDHQMVLAPFLGRSFNSSFVYAGAGPSLSHLEASPNDIVGFANITGGQLTGLLDISGRPQPNAQSQWAFGVAATAGITNFITPSWFLDLNYTFSNPFPHKFNVNQGYHNDLYNPFIFEGALVGFYTAKAITHSITLSINVGF